MDVKSYRDLQVWRKAHELVLLVFKVTDKSPRTDQFGIVSQVRRSASSVAANIAEGFGRGTTKEFLRSLQIARGELEETRYFIFLSCDLGKISKEDNARVDAVCDSTGKLINALGRSLRSKISARGQSLVTSHDRVRGAANGREIRSCRTCGADYRTGARHSI